MVTVTGWGVVPMYPAGPQNVLSPKAMNVINLFNFV